MKKLSAIFTALAMLSTAAVFPKTEIRNVSAIYNMTDYENTYTILDTITLGSDGAIPCYDCAESMTSTKKLANYIINDEDKKILQNFIDEHFTDDMTNTEKIAYTIDWLYSNIDYAITNEEFKKITNVSLAKCGFDLKLGQCLQYNGALAYMLEYMGYEANLIRLKNGTWQHYTCQIRVDGRAYRMEAGNKGLSDGSHYMPKSMLTLETALNTDSNLIIGQCGTSAYYTFDKTTGTLTVDGAGSVTELNNENINPEDISSMIFKEGITEINGYIFYGCTNLNDITFPDSLSSINGNGLADTPFIQNLNGFGITKNGYLYAYNGTDTEITIPDTVKIIGNGIFMNNSTLQKVTISDSVIKIGKQAFAYCENLADVTIPDSVVSMDSSSFTGTPFISNQTSDFVTAGCFLFKYQGNDSEIVIPENIRIIGASAFNGNKDITSVVFPPNLKTIESYAFMGCSNLKEINLPDSTEEILSFAFSKCSSLTEAVLPENLKFISYGLFADCTNLQTVTIPEGITAIQNYAFTNSKYNTETSQTEVTYSIEEINYKGDEEKWNALTKSVDEEWTSVIKVNFIESFITGDTDGDGTVTSTDALNVLLAVVDSTELTTAQIKAADIDNNNEINSEDALGILKIVIGE